MGAIRACRGEWVLRYRSRNAASQHHAQNEADAPLLQIRPARSTTDRCTERELELRSTRVDQQRRQVCLCGESFGCRFLLGFKPTGGDLRELLYDEQRVRRATAGRDDHS